MRNPFEYGGVVRGEAFCNREREIADLVRAMENGERLFLYAERRLGKTSLVLSAIERLPRRKFVVAYVDLWPTDGDASFVSSLARALAEARSSTASKLLATAKSLFSRLTPSLTVGDDGRPVLVFGVPSRADLGPELREVLQAPGELARGRRSVVIVFDEFQRIQEYETDRVERQLRTVIQHQSGVSYLFLGSRKHLLEPMFTGASRPLYRAAARYPLGPIGVEYWRPFIQAKFEAAAKRIGRASIEEIQALTEGHPFYTQHLCHVLWERCAPGGEVTAALVEDAVALLLDRESFAYATLWDSFTLNQQRFVRGLANEPRGAQPFAGEFVHRYGLRSTSNSQRAAEALLKRDVIDREDGSFIISDRFFRLWVRRRQSL
jgi:AAA+ ATPase superfamily predicted ATPase